MASNCSNKRFEITIIGAGIGGLSAAICLARKGHRIGVLERHKGLSEYGAGIQVTPNAVRILDNWGLRQAFEEIAFVPNLSVARRYRTGETIGATHQNPDSEAVYGFPYWQIYRPDLQRVLAEAARKAGVKIRYGVEVVQLDAEKGIVKLMNGTRVASDLVVCADGIRSIARALIRGNESVTPIPFHEYNYRAMIPSTQMMADPETAELMYSKNTQAWLGPGRAIIAYPISNGKLFNIAISVPRPSDAPIGRWNEPGDLRELHGLFPDFCGLAQKMIGLARECAKWTIAEVPPLATWSSQSGRTTLLGDAAHAMSPHAAQGAAMSLEDAAVLGECLDHAKDLQDLRLALERYEVIRKPRVERIAEIARTNGTLWVVPDGPLQEARDQRFKTVMEEDEKERANLGREGMQARRKLAPDKGGKWPQPGVLMWVYGYDAVAEAARYLQESIRVELSDGVAS